MEVQNDIKHIAFIMDGNGRWAKKRMMPREYGHNFGAKKFREVASYCYDIGVPYVTFYAFSTENWKRPVSEVNAIMKLFMEYLDEAQKSRDKDVGIAFLGEKMRFSEEMRSKMKFLENATSACHKKLCIAINYGGRAEIVDAVNKLFSEGKTEITEEDITNNIYSGICPPPDMIIRTGGEMRLSNFLMWQSAYSELFFTDTLWPDLRKSEIDDIIEQFGKRKRRFGGV
ncbi:MAG: di-trans,poly-cis-decaprenylcistransferase [Clostridia bacterium]|nr:di-trans,poly-cis-decaprenylcistransferase [Clostridia bacterium]